jgi:threonine/homoserine/homoserine lactone efflux protein
MKFTMKNIRILSVTAILAVIFVVTMRSIGRKASNAQMDSATHLLGTLLGLYLFYLFWESKRPKETRREDQHKMEVGSEVGSEDQSKTVWRPSSIRCFNCKAEIAVPPELLGKKTRCRKCGAKNQMPG